MKLPAYLKARPKFIRVFGRMFLVQFVPPSDLGSSAVGLCQNTEFLISVADGQHPVEEFDTLLHEIMHAVWFVMSASMGGADEEQIVRRVSTGLTGVFMDNPQLLKYFSMVQKEVNG
jgi:hypothetical protein